MALTSHFPLPKTLKSSKQFAVLVKFALIISPLSNGVTGDRSTKTNDNFLSGSTVLPLIEKTNQILSKYKKLLEEEKKIVLEVELGG